MSRLLRANLYRLFKDKMIYIIVAIVFGFALLSAALMEFVASVAGSDAAELGIAIGSNARSLFLNGLSISNNVGIAFPIFIAIYLCKDYQYGTIRNQIISGHTKTSIYVASLITALILGVGMFLLNAVANFLVGLLFGGYGAPFEASEVGFLLSTLGLSVLITMLITTFTHFVSLSIKNLALTIVITIVTLMLLSMVSVVSVFESFLPGWLVEILTYVPSMQNMSLINGAMATADAGTLTFKVIVSSIGISAICIVTGLLKYRKSEMK